MTGVQTCALPIYLYSSSKWSDSFKSLNGNRSESSVHGLLSDEDAAEDDLELVNIDKSSTGGVDVAFTGEPLCVLIHVSFLHFSTLEMINGF